MKTPAHINERNKLWYQTHKHEINKDRVVYNREWRKGKAEKIKTYNWKNHLKRKYGITPQEYQLKFDKQEGKCAICGIHQSQLKHPLGVDHNHTTKKNRDLLCVRCNTALGSFQENIQILELAINYLKKHQE